MAQPSPGAVEVFQTQMSSGTRLLKHVCHLIFKASSYKVGVFEKDIGSCGLEQLHQSPRLLGIKMDVQIWHFCLREGNEDGPSSFTSLSRITKHHLMASKTSGKKVTGNQFDPGFYNEMLVKEDLSLK